MLVLLERLRSRLQPLGVAPAEALALLVLLSGAVALTVVVWLGSQAGGVGAESSDRGTIPSNGPSPGPSSMGPSSPGPSSTDSPGANSPGTVASSDMPSAQGPPVSGVPTDGAGQPSTVVVHVSGAVVRPGVVELSGTARVHDAIDRAGGGLADADLDLVNLARPVVDGEQIHVPRPGETPRPVQPGAPPPEGGPAPAGPVNLNTADATQLEALPGVGPVMAERIIAHREQIGGFVDVTQLLEVAGIGAGRFGELQDLVSV